MILSGVVFAVVVVVILLWQLFYFTRSDYSFLISALIIAVLFFVGIMLKNKIEFHLLQRMKGSVGFDDFLKKFNWKKVEMDYYEATIEGYFATLHNYASTKIFSKGRERALVLDIYCDCSAIRPKEIRAIESKGFIVTHHSIRSWSNKWTIRFNPEKISERLVRQLEMVSKYELDLIKEEELKNREY